MAEIIELSTECDFGIGINPGFVNASPKKGEIDR
jgi:hypothetical protein